MSVHISACWPFPWTDPCTDFGQLMHHDAFGRDLCTCGLHFIGQSEILDVPPQPNSPPENVLRPDRPAEASLGSKRRGCYPASDSRIGLESSSTGSSFPADSAKPVPLAVVSLDSRQGHRIPLVRTSYELAVRHPGKAPERAVPSPSPGRHEVVRSRHVSSSSSPPTVDGGCSPWRPDAVMSTTGRERHSVLRIFKGRRECTGHHATCGALPAAGPYLRLSRFLGRALQRHPFSGLVDSAVVCKGFYPPLGGNYNSRRSERRFHRTDLANDTCLWEPKLLLRVGNRAAGACVASSPDSDIGRADIEGSKSNVAMNAWLPQASYPCGKFSDTSSFKFRRSKGSIGHAFTVRIRTENQNQTSFYPFVPHEISVLVELILGHLRYLLTDVPPQPNSPPDTVLRPDRPAEASLGSKRRGCYPASDSRIGLESSSTGSSFPADSAKPVPLAVVLLDSRQGHRIPLVRTSSELAVRRPGKAPERAVPSPSPGRHEAVRSRHVSSSSSPPTVDGFGTGTPEPSPQSQSFSRSYGSILPTSLAYIVPSTRGCSPWRPDAVMSTTGRERHSVLRIFKGRQECTGHHAMCGALPAAGPYLRLSLFRPNTQVRRTICTSMSLRASTRHAHTRTLLRRSRSVDCAPVRDPANQLPCALRVYSPVDSHTCQTPWSVFQDGSNGEPTGRCPEHADAEAHREARAADHD
ncbi:unnamed protein product [Brassica rapa subsp. narinosa]